MYDFSSCKLCREKATPVYRLKNCSVYACSACDFHFIDHLDGPPPEPDAAKRLDQKGRAYIERMLVPNGLQLRKNLSLVKQHQTVAQANCLDIGAGAGLFSSLVAAEGGITFGIEPQQVFREFAREKFGLTLNHETIEAPHWQQGHANFFHVVTMWDVLEHLDFPAETVQYAFKVTRPGGWLFLDTPCRDSLFYILSQWSYKLGKEPNPRMLQSLYSPEPYRHKQLFTLEQLVRLVTGCGFTLVRKNTMIPLLQNKIVLACRKPEL